MSLRENAPSETEATPNRLAPGLYVVATPVGNLADITRRAVAVLAAADVIACEDTRVARRLLAALGIAGKRLLRYDDHSAERVRPKLIVAMQRGESVALISDAGTPLVADPGYKLVRESHAAGLRVAPVPGPSAIVAALSVAGLPTDRFLFCGFLPAKPGERARTLDELARVDATLVVLEAPHRLAGELAAMAERLGPREAVVARELTKLFEELRRGTLAELAHHYATAGAPKGEIVVVVGPPPAVGPPVAAEADVDQALAHALPKMSVRDAVDAVAKTTGLPRRAVYARAIRLARQGGH